MNKADKYISDLLQDMLTRFPNIVMPLQYQYYEDSDMHFIQMEYGELFEDNAFAHYCLAKYREFLLKFGSSLCVMRPDDVLTLDNPSIVIDTRQVYYSNLVVDNFKKQGGFKNLPQIEIQISNLIDTFIKKEKPSEENKKTYAMAA